MDVLGQQVQQLQEQLTIKEQENQQLTAQLQHLRSWMNSLQQRARANDPHALLVARELYVGGVPEGTTEVTAAITASMHCLQRLAPTPFREAAKRGGKLVCSIRYVLACVSSAFPGRIQRWRCCSSAT